MGAPDCSDSLHRKQGSVRNGLTFRYRGILVILQSKIPHKNTFLNNDQK